MKDAPPLCDEALFKWYLEKLQETGVLASPTPVPSDQADVTPQEAPAMPA